MRFRNLNVRHLSTKIILIITPVIFIILVIFAFVVYGALKHALMDYIKEDLKEEINRVKRELRIENERGFDIGILNYLFLDSRVIASVEEREILWLDSNFRWIRKPFAEFDLSQIRNGLEVIHPRKKIHFFIKAETILNHEVILAKNLSSVYHGLHELLIALVITVPVVIVLMNLFIMFVINVTLRPIRSTIQTARLITAQNLSRRIQEPGGEDEIGQLVKTLNEMIERLETGYQKIYNFAGNVAHELRTPLTLISGELELAMKWEEDPEILSWMQNIYNETQFLKKMINRLLLLTRLENRLIEPALYEINMTQILKRCAERFQLMAQEKNLEIDLLGECRSTVFADEALLEEVVDILIENAIKYSHPGGKIELKVECDDQYCHIKIFDNCGEKAHSLQSEMFRRFHGKHLSSRKRDGGLGIGLSIAKEIAEYHHGKISCEPAPPQGCVFTISLPLAIYEDI